MTPSPATPAPRQADAKFPAFVEWTLLSLGFVLPAWSSWQRWTDPLVDFGRQPYVAWRLLEGDRLYEDLAHVFGPFAAHLHAGVMTVFGVSLASLVWFNLFLIACFALHIRVFFGWLGGSISGLGAALGFLLLCAFPQYIFQANYNFVTPYSADLVYGLMLAMLCLSLVLRRGQGRADTRRWILAGICLGSVTLCKPEVCMALVSALLVMLIRRPPGWHAFRRFSGAAGLTLCAVFLGFLPTHGVSGAVGAVFGGFAPLSRMSVAGTGFYLWVSGFDAPWEHLTCGLFEFAAVLVMVGAGVGLARLALAFRGAALAIAAVLLLALPAVLLLLQDVVVQQGLTFLPFALIAIIFFLLRGGRSSSDVARADAWLVLAVFALSSLLKILLAARLFHYGFALAMPGIVFLIAWLLAAPCAPDVGHWWRRLPLIALALALALSHVDSSRRHYAMRNFDLLSAGDRIRGFGPDRDPRGPLVQAFLDWQRTSIPPHATMLVLPDAAMLNFLSRHAAGNRYYALPSPELAFHGEEVVLASLIASPPDFVVLVDQPSALLGRFGDGTYGSGILEWVGANYAPTVLFGAEPLAGHGFGIGVLERRRRVNDSLVPEHQ